MAITVSDFLRLALSEIRSARAGDVVNADDLGDALILFNEYLDLLNATGRSIYTTTVGVFVLTPALQPHTIGLAANSPTWTVTTTRPVHISMPMLRVPSSTGATKIPVNVRDEAWWNALRSPLITSAYPTDLFYSPDWPNGQVNLWPIPTTAYGIEFTFDTVFAEVALTDTFSLPPGYQTALRLTTAEFLAPMFGQTVSPSTKQKAAEARGVVWGTNDVVPRVIADGGLTLGGSGSGGGYDYRTGFNE
jgi:hypothetical protein